MYHHDLASRIERLALPLSLAISIAAPVLVVLAFAAHQG